MSELFGRLLLQISMLSIFFHAVGKCFLLVSWFDCYWGLTQTLVAQSRSGSMGVGEYIEG